MEENKTGQDQTQNDHNEEQTSQNEHQEQPYRVFKDESEYKKFTDGFYKDAYNSGKTKGYKDSLSKLADEFGVEAESLDDAISALKEKAPKNNSKDADDKFSAEVEELRKRYQELEQRYEDRENELRLTKMNNIITKQSSDAFNALQQEGELKLDKKALETLFFAEYEVNADENGNYYAVNGDGVPDLNDKGDRRSLAESIQSFIKRNNYITPRKQGAGGATGGTVAGDKPKRSEFQELLRSRSPEDRKKAEELYAKMKEVGGWAQE